MSYGLSLTFRAVMEVWKTVREARHGLAGRQDTGLIPTMGALHEGHMSLVEAALRQGAYPVASVFINRLQFNQAKDFEAYPQTFEADLAGLKAAGCQAVFCPSDGEMYPQNTHLSMSFGHLDTVLEGALRPGHFSGVGVVVSKLFHILQPKWAFFGEKDLQQLAVIRRLVQDLSFPIEVVPCKTHRTPTGLALSSRNLRLSSDGLEKAAVLHKVLQTAWASANRQSIDWGLEKGRQILEAEPGFTLEYLEAVDPYTFELKSALDTQAQGPFALCVAAWLEGVRLIDNLIRWH